MVCFQMSMGEAKRRAAVHGMAIQYRNSEFRVFFPELSGDRQEATAYYTDDVEDAALTAGSMRTRLNGLRAE